MSGVTLDTTGENYKEVSEKVVLGGTLECEPFGLLNLILSFFYWPQADCLKEERTVAGDNTISYKGKLYQILPDEYLDGSIHIFYQDKKITHKPILKEKTKPKTNELITLNH